MADTPPLVLASTSAYRRTLMDRLGVPYEAVPHRCDETPEMRSGKTPPEIATTLARDKAESLAAAYPDAFVLGSDQVVDLDGSVLGKPGSEDATVAQLQRLRGRTHRLITAVALRHPDGTFREACDIHQMRMRDLDDAALRRYVVRDRPYDCAGGYKVEEAGIALFEAIDGRDFTAIVGLPMITVVSLLRAAGFAVP